MRLLVVSGPDAGSSFPLKSSCVLRVGRGAECDIALHDPSVSRVQFEVRVESRRAILQDLGSRWGTLVNGVQQQTVELHPGDTIRIGETELQFTSEEMLNAATIPPQDLGLPDLNSMCSDGIELEVAGRLDLSSPERLAGRVVGMYTIRRVEAEARTGIVFQALDRDQQLTALKLLRPETMHPDALQRFLRMIVTMKSRRQKLH